MSKLFAFCLYCLASTAGAIELTDPNFHNVTSCFSGPFASYDSWQAALAPNNPNPKELINSPQAMQIDASRRARFEHYRHTIICENFDYVVDGVLVRGFYVAPSPYAATEQTSSSTNRKLPLIIFNRGGNGDFGALRFGEIMREFFPMAAQGFVIVGSQYRGFIKKIPSKELFKNIPSAGKDEFGGKDVNDVLKLVELAKFFPQVDSKSIGMYGASRGGMMTYMAAKRTDSISAIAIAAGVVDLAKELSFRPAMEEVYKARIPNYASEKEKVLIERSAIHWADKIPKTVPILILHGDKDEKVDVNNALRMDQKLTELNHPHKLVIYQGGDHSFSKYQKEMQAELIAWFKEKLVKQ